MYGLEELVFVFCLFKMAGEGEDTVPLTAGAQRDQDTSMQFRAINLVLAPWRL